MHPRHRAHPTALVCLLTAAVLVGLAAARVSRAEPNDLRAPEIVWSSAGHTGSPPVVFSADGRLMATGGSNEIKIWDTSGAAAEWSLLRTIRTHGGRVRSLAFDPQGRWIFNTTQGHVLMQWQVADGALVREFQAAFTNSTGSHPLSVSRDGAYIAAAGLYPSQTAIWRVSDGVYLRSVGNNIQSYAAGVSFSPTQDLMAASGSFGGAVWRVSDLINPGTSTPPALFGFGKPSLPVIFSPDGTRIAQPEGVYSAVNGSLIHTAGGLRYSGDGSRLVTYQFRTVKLYNAAGALVGQFDASTENLSGLAAVALSYSGDVLVTSGYGAAGDARLTLWDTADTSRALRRLNGFSTGISAVGFSTDGGLVAAAEGGRNSFREGIRIWETTGFTQQRTLPGHSFGSSVLAFSPGGDVLAAGGNDWDTYPSFSGQLSVKVWRLSDGQLLRQIPLPDHSPRLAFSPDGRLLAIGVDNPSRTTQVVDVYSGMVTAAWGSSTSGVGGMAFLPDGTLLIRHSRDERVRRWRVTNGAVLLSEFGPVGASGPGSGAMAVSPDGLTLATCSFESTAAGYYSRIRLWRIADGALLGTLHQHLNPTSFVVFYSLAFSPDGQSLIAGGRGSDQALRIWRLSNGAVTSYTEEVGAGQGSILGVAASSAGGLYAYGRDDATLVVARNPYSAPRDTTAPEISVPEDLTVEAISAAGAVVTFNVSATDAGDPNPTVTANPASGATFPLGTTTVQVTATDATGNTASGSFKVTVVDTTAPALALPPAQSFEATGPDGAVVSYTEATATDAVGPVTLTHTPAPGNRLPLGTTTVQVEARDGAGNESTGSFAVTVRDTTAPALDLPTDLTVEATSAAGAVVTFGVGATDAVDLSPMVTANPAAGATFPLGTTTVQVTAKDAAGSMATGSFKVAVVDTTPPVLSLPQDLEVEATSSAGAVVTFTSSASDLVDGSVAVTCTPASGTVFAPGTTTVSCTATDAAGNRATGTFRVRVTFGWSGVLDPINADGSSVFKAGSTAAVKFQLAGASAGITDLAARLSYAKLAGEEPGEVNEAGSTAAATVGNLFRYDAESGRYVFNWSTKGLTTGRYRLYLDLGDGAPRTVDLGLR